jgi:5-aminolevulinate synthase
LPVLFDASKPSEEFFTTRLDALMAEGPYRVFAELERCVSEFPRALERRLGSDVTVWCSNDARSI